MVETTTIESDKNSMRNIEVKKNEEEKEIKNEVEKIMIVIIRDIREKKRMGRIGGFELPTTMPFFSEVLCDLNHLFV